MSLKHIGSRGLAIFLSALLCPLPECLHAQATPSSQSQPQAQTQQNGAASDAQTAPHSQAGTSVPDPAQAPLAPVPSARPDQPNSPPPDAPSEVQRSQQAQTPPTTSETPSQQQQPAIPLGTATAQQGATRGGAASKPAGEAIAPAKQRQVHSLLLRLGLVAAGAVAVGTVVALTRGTSSVPPGAH